jgi:hypothetical protein
MLPCGIASAKKGGCRSTRPGLAVRGWRGRSYSRPLNSTVTRRFSARPAGVSLLLPAPAERVQSHRLAYVGTARRGRRHNRGVAATQRRAASQRQLTLAPSQQPGRTFGAPPVFARPAKVGQLAAHRTGIPLNSCNLLGKTRRNRHAPCPPVIYAFACQQQVNYGVSGGCDRIALAAMFAGDKTTFTSADI